MNNKINRALVLEYSSFVLADIKIWVSDRKQKDVDRCIPSKNIKSSVSRFHTWV